MNDVVKKCYICGSNENDFFNLTKKHKIDELKSLINPIHSRINEYKSILQKTDNNDAKIINLIEELPNHIKNLKVKTLFEESAAIKIDYPLIEELLALIKSKIRTNSLLELKDEIQSEKYTLNITKIENSKNQKQQQNIKIAEHELKIINEKISFLNNLEKGCIGNVFLKKSFEINRNKSSKNSIITNSVREFSIKYQICISDAFKILNELFTIIQNIKSDYNKNNHVSNRSRIKIPIMSKEEYFIKLSEKTDKIDLHDISVNNDFLVYIDTLYQKGSFKNEELNDIQFTLLDFNQITVDLCPICFQASRYDTYIP